MPRAGQGEARRFYEALEPTDDCVIWPFARSRKGYAFMRLGEVNGEVHRFVCMRFHGAPRAGQDAAHSCGNRACVNPAHLRWATRKENSRDMVRHGTRRRGETHPSARLTAADVTEIRHLRQAGWRLRRIAEQFGVTEGHISRIVQHRARTAG